MYIMILDLIMIYNDLDINDRFIDFYFDFYIIIFYIDEDFVNSYDFMLGEFCLNKVVIIIVCV